MTSRVRCFPTVLLRRYQKGNHRVSFVHQSMRRYIAPNAAFNGVAAVVIPELAPTSPTAEGPSCGSCVASSMVSMSTTSALVTQVRNLKIAKSVFGFYLGRQGQRKYPFHRRPHFKGLYSANLNAPYFWSFATAKSQCFFLPEDNYITGDWTGKFFVSRRQVYTLQHATSGAKCRMKRFPSTFEFNNPSRWNIGKELMTLSKPRMDLIDEQMLTKKQRLDYVKAGLLPK